MKVAMEESYKNRTNAKDFVLLDNYMCVSMLAVLDVKLCVCMFAGNKKYSTQCQEFCIFIIVCMYVCVCMCVRVWYQRTKTFSNVKGFMFFKIVSTYVCVWLCVFLSIIYILYLVTVIILKQGYTTTILKFWIIKILHQINKFWMFFYFKDSYAQIILYKNG